jgi:hypothetical protein
VTQKPETAGFLNRTPNVSKDFNHRTKDFHQSAFKHHLKVKLLLDLITPSQTPSSCETQNEMVNSIHFKCKSDASLSRDGEKLAKDLREKAI